MGCKYTSAMNASDDKDLGTINDMINRTATELSALLSMRDQIVLKNAGTKPSMKETIIVTTQVIAFVLLLSVISALAIAFLATTDVSSLINQ